MSGIVLPNGVRRAVPGEARQAADIIAEAFRDDPFNRWLFGDFRAMRSVFRRFARDVYIRRAVAHVAGDAGAAFWTPPGINADLSAWGLMRLLAAVRWHGGRSAVARARIAGEAMAAAHPSAPHWYLFLIGTLPAARGSGMGKRLMAAVLDECDRTRVGAYLENSNPANTGFYLAHGFEARGALPLPDDAPPLIAMWRAPKSGGRSEAWAAGPTIGEDG